MPIYKIAGQKKDGLQKYRVVVNYTDESGKKRTVERREYGKAQAERAEAVLRERIKSSERPKERTKAKPMTVNELAKLYEAGRGPEIRETTMSKKKSVLNCYVLPFLGEKPLGTIGEEDMRSWRRWLNEKHEERGIPGASGALEFCSSGRLSCEKPDASNRAVPGPIQRDGGRPASVLYCGGMEEVSCGGDRRSGEKRRSPRLGPAPFFPDCLLYGHEEGRDQRSAVV